MSRLKKFDPTYKLDKTIEKEIERGTFVTERETQNGIRREYLRQRPATKIRYEMDIETRKKVAIGLIGGVIGIATLVGVYSYVDAKTQEQDVEYNEDKFIEEKPQEKQNIETAVNKFIDEEKISEIEEKVQRDEIIEDLSQMSASELQNYTKQVIVDVYNKKNPENQIEMQNFSYSRSHETLAINKDKLGNVVSYSIYKWGNFEENRDLEFQKAILEFYLDGKLIARMKEDGSPIEMDGDCNYDFSEFAVLLLREKNLEKDLNNMRYVEDNRSLIEQIELGQEYYASAVQKLKQENVIGQAEQIK